MNSLYSGLTRACMSFPYSIHIVCVSHVRTPKLTKVPVQAQLTVGEGRPSGRGPSPSAGHRGEHGDPDQELGFQQLRGGGREGGTDRKAFQKKRHEKAQCLRPGWFSSCLGSSLAPRGAT